MSFWSAFARIPKCGLALEQMRGLTGSRSRPSEASAGFGYRRPPPLAEAFECREARLVGHLRALGDPIAEIDVGQLRATALLDQPQDAPGAEAAALVRGIVKAVDGRNAVIEPIDQRYRDERALRRADFHDRSAHRAVLDHAAVIGVAHRRHVAVAVPRALVGGEQLELLRCRARREEPPG